MFAPIIKKRFNNKVENKNFITGYISLNGYIQDMKYSCTYHRLRPHKKSYEEKFSENTGCFVHFINCGHGDACLIENQGRYALIDFGAKEGCVLEYLQKNMKGKTLDYAICTHIHEDHMADFENVCKNYKIKNMMLVKNIDEYRRSVEKEIIKIQKFCNADNLIMLEAENCLKNHSHDFKLGDVNFQFVGPIKDYSNLNDNSIVLKASYNDVSLLFTGDISQKAEREIINYCKMKDIDLGCKVIKVPHHGSEKSSCKNFLDFVSPEYAIMSCGEINKYSHPDKTTVDRYNNAEIKMFYTYKTDCVYFEINQKGDLYSDYFSKTQVFSQSLSKDVPSVSYQAYQNDIHQKLVNTEEDFIESDDEEHYLS